MNRRRFVRVAATTALAATGCAKLAVLLPPPALAPGYRGANSLKTRAANRGFLYGCAVDTDALEQDERYASLIRDQANIVVAENAMKWGPLRPTPESYDFTGADRLLAFAEQHRMKVRGHTLCWHRQLPAWFAAEANAGNARQVLAGHIQTVAGRYAGRMHSWDVVNEAILPSDGRPDGLRASPWLRLVGEDYIELAFRTARNADPQALLAYNDYGLEGEDEDSARKRAAVLILLRRLKARHVPLDALGIQSHLAARQSCGAGLREFLTAARELELQIFVTEMDVDDRKLPPGLPARDQAVAATYNDYLNLVLRDPAVRVVVTWGITDRYTWLNSQDARAGQPPERCLPFDSGYTPKPSFYSIRNQFDQRKPLPPASTV
jgi:endo-1,4-beta-xylanase